MIEELKLYRCPVCDTVVEVLDRVGFELNCCGPALTPILVNDGCERDLHLPVAHQTEDGLRVRVGTIPHTMEDDHHIKWIEVASGDTCLRKFLHAGQLPEAVFEVHHLGPRLRLRAYCNRHGLWQREIDNVPIGSAARNSGTRRSCCPTGVE